MDGRLQNLFYIRHCLSHQLFLYNPSQVSYIFRFTVNIGIISKIERNSYILIHLEDREYSVRKEQWS